MAETGINWDACKSLLSREGFDAIFGNVIMGQPNEPHPKADRLWWPNGAPKRGPVARKTFAPPYNGPCQVCGQYAGDGTHSEPMCSPCRERHREITQAQFVIEFGLIPEDV